MCGPTANNPLNVYGVEVATYTRSAQKKKIETLCRLAAIAS
jgi:hypothetical protein